MYKWKTKIPKIRKAISNIRFYLALDLKLIDNKLNSLIDELWKAILSEVKENELELVDIYEIDCDLGLTFDKCGNITCRNYHLDKLK